MAAPPGVGAGEQASRAPTASAEGAADQLHEHERRAPRPGRCPAKVSESVRATVTAGLAKLVELVNQYAAVM